MSLNPNQRVIHRRLSRDYSDSSDDSDDNSQKQAPPKKGPGPVTGGAGQATGGKVPEKNGLVLKPSLSLEPYDVAFKLICQISGVRTTPLMVSSTYSQDGTRVGGWKEKISFEFISGWKERRRNNLSEDNPANDSLKLLVRWNACRQVAREDKFRIHFRLEGKKKE
ncbi:hypothetical protein CEXT_295141 [Caerostris extrusa]|uniref:Uncharacterized protein n=1 Tax=Caerostris extrusa TaxID=172846 RepID=A0AAV4XHM8_CAEEX|nr:hypothetical protein CEXT_295141 [Caerostris extrusa]